MKKLIVTLCSLALSLAGTFGLNQLASNDEAIIDRNKEQVSVEQEAEAIEHTADADEIMIVTNDDIEDKPSEVEVATPKAEDTDTIDIESTEEEREVKKDKKATVKSKDKRDNRKSSSNKADNSKAKKEDTKQETAKNIGKNTSKNTVKNTSKNTNKKAVTNKTDNNTATNKSINKNNDYINDYKSKDNNVYVYKNIDLSNCNSTQDVVKELQKSGYKNINMNNIQNISSLEEILSLIGDKGTQGKNNKPVPTTVPSKPAPTTTPTKPAPTTPTKPAPTTPSTPAPTAPPKDNSGSNQGFAEEVLRLVNIERSKAGLSSLTTNATLQAAANKRAEETKVSFSHTRPNGSKFSTALQEYGVSYRTAGENIAYGQRSPQEVVNGWMNSPGHRANILNGSFGKIGIGVYTSGGVIYWAQLFTD